MKDTPARAEIDRFIIDKIDTVPHIEALLLLWREDAEPWVAEGVAKRLWIELEEARRILQDLSRENLIVLVANESGRYRYRADPDNNRLLQAVAQAYQQEMIRISTMIHSKPSSAVRAFAQAFRFKKEQD